MSDGEWTFSAEAQEWLRGYHGPIDSTALLIAFDAGRRQGQLDPRTVVGTPWTTPLKGDKCVRQDGKSREAWKVVYRQNWPAVSRKPATVEVPTKGYYCSLITYRDQNGREDTISASSWATWCRAACRNGGTYTRAEAS